MKNAGNLNSFCKQSNSHSDVRLRTSEASLFCECNETKWPLFWGDEGPGSNLIAFCYTVSMPKFENLMSQVTPDTSEGFENDTIRAIAERQDAVVAKMQRQLQSLFDDALEYSKHDHKKLETFFETEILSMPPNALLFFSRMVDQAHRITEGEADEQSKKVAEEFDSIFEKWMSPPSRVKHPVTKTGEMSLWLSNSMFVLERALPTEGVAAWEKASELVPVEQILKAGKFSDEGETVYSRYCGLQYHDVRDIYKGNAQELIEKLQEKRFTIMMKMAEHEIVHGHYHTGNFTVEFIRKTALQEFAKQQGLAIEDPEVLSLHPVVNELPYNDDDFIFDPVEGIRNLNEFVPVVRVIDFDLATLPNQQLLKYKRKVEEDYLQMNEADREAFKRFLIERGKTPPESLLD